MQPTKCWRDLIASVYVPPVFTVSFPKRFRDDTASTRKPAPRRTSTAVVLEVRSSLRQLIHACVVFFGDTFLSRHSGAFVLDYNTLILLLAAATFFLLRRPRRGAGKLGRRAMSMGRSSGSPRRVLKRCPVRPTFRPADGAFAREKSVAESGREKKQVLSVLSLPNSVP